MSNGVDSRLSNALVTGCGRLSNALVGHGGRRFPRLSNGVDGFSQLKRGGIPAPSARKIITKINLPSIDIHYTR